MTFSKTKQEIEDDLCNWLEKLIVRKQKEYAARMKATPSAKSKPFHEALLLGNVTKAADFERSFSTSLGKTFERSAQIIARAKFAIVEEQYETTGKIPTNTNAEIDKVITKINKGNIFDNYKDEVVRIVKLSKSDSSKLVDKSVISDLYLKSKDGKEIFFEMKTVKLNKEQCLNITRQHLSIHSMKQLTFPRIRPIMEWHTILMENLMNINIVLQKVT